MLKRHLFYLTIAVSTIVYAEETHHQNSISGNIHSYREACLKAVNSPAYFHNFRSMPEYASILECGFEGESSQYLLKNASKKIIEKLDVFRILDEYGNPTTHKLPKIGKFSGTTLRYIVIADQIEKFFDLPPQPKIAEIGAGFGGQCYILSKTIPFSNYYIFDLPEPELLIEKMMKTLSVDHVSLISQNEPLLEKKIDLLISNYAFSECDRQTQLHYFNKVLLKAERGYMVYNQLNYFDSFSADELITLLNNHNMKPELHEEPIFTYKDNVLIIWDKTKK